MAENVKIGVRKSVVSGATKGSIASDADKILAAQMPRDQNGRAKAPLLISDDRSVKDALTGFIEKLPDNTFYLFYDPVQLDVDDLGILVEKAVRRYYQPGLTLADRWATVFKPRLRDGVANLRQLDLDSYKYIEPILYHTDQMTLNLLEPLFYDKRNKFYQKKSFDDSFFGERHRADSPYDKARQLSTDLKALSSDIEVEGFNAESEARFNALIKNVYIQKAELREKLRILSDQAKATLNQIDEIQVSTAKASLKRERVKSLREHVLRIEKQGADLYKALHSTEKNLLALGKSRGNTEHKLQTQLQNLAVTLDGKLDASQKVVEGLADMSHARQRRKVRVRNEEGRIIQEQDALTEHYRLLGLGIDLNFVPDAPRTLPIVEPKEQEHNAENYFLKTISYAKSQAFDKDGNYIPAGQRAVVYGREMADYITYMFQLGKPEDALFAIKLLKMTEGKDSKDAFPSEFHKMVEDKLASSYGKSSAEIRDDPYAKLFLDRLKSLSEERDHSPLIYGPRDIKERYQQFIEPYLGGRMYPGAGAFLATPLTQELLQWPAIKFQSGMFAYLTGGSLAPVSDLSRKVNESSVLEHEIGLYVKRNWWFQPKQEKSEENPNPPNWLDRAPFWVSGPVRTSAVASIPAAAVLLGTGAALTAPVILVGAVGGGASLVYGAKVAKNTWALPFVHKPIKFAAKWTVITGATVGGAVLLAPYTPVIAAAAVASPGVAAGIASPFLLLGGIKAKQIFGKKNEPIKAKEVSFGEYRNEMEIEDDPHQLYANDGEFLKIEPNPPEDIEINVRNGIYGDINSEMPGADRELSGTFNPAQMAGIQGLGNIGQEISDSVNKMVETNNVLAEQNAQLLSYITNKEIEQQPQQLEDAPDDPECH